MVLVSMDRVPRLVLPSPSLGDVGLHISSLLAKERRVNLGFAAKSIAMIQASSIVMHLAFASGDPQALIEPHNPSTAPTKGMMNIASAILRVVHVLLFS